VATKRSILDGGSDAQLADRLHSVAIHFLRQLRREDAALGITAARLSALSVIVFAGPLRLGDVAVAEGVSAPTMTRLVRALEADGLVRRTPDPIDSRAVQLAATAKGRRLLERGRRRRTERLAGDLAALTEAQHEVLAEAISILEGLVGGRHQARP